MPESGKRFRYVLGVVARRFISAVGLYVLVLGSGNSYRYELIYMRVVVDMSAFGAYEVNVRPVDYFSGVLALAWHVYIVLAVLYVCLLSFLLVWLGVCCFYSSIYILYIVSLCISNIFLLLQRCQRGVEAHKDNSRYWKNVFVVSLWSDGLQKLLDHR